jgi:hypothetical protein
MTTTTLHEVAQAGCLSALGLLPYIHKDVPVPLLADPPSDDARRLLKTVAKGFSVGRGTWPVWQYVLLRLDADGFDGEKILQGLPTWQHHYRPVTFSSSVSLPDLSDQVALTMYGMVHADGYVTEPLVKAFLAAIAEADETQRGIDPRPTAVVQVEVDSREFTVRVNKRAGSALSERQLFEVLRREPATWGGLQEAGDAWRWDLSRLRLHPYREVKTGRAYLEALEALVGAAIPPSIDPVLPPLALPEAFDHLDLAWRLVTKSKLVRVPRATVPARLTQPVQSVEEFESRCSALSDLLASFDVPVGSLPSNSGSLQRMSAELERLLGDRASTAVAAVVTLRRVAGIRNAQQHTGSAVRYDRDRAALGLSRFGSDWSGAWSHLEVVTVESLTTIREELVSLLD